MILQGNEGLNQYECTTGIIVFSLSYHVKCGVSSFMCLKDPHLWMHVYFRPMCRMSLKKVGLGCYFFLSTLFFISRLLVGVLSPIIFFCAPFDSVSVILIINCFY